MRMPVTVMDQPGNSSSLSAEGKPNKRISLPEMQPVSGPDRTRYISIADIIANFQIYYLNIDFNPYS